MELLKAYTFSLYIGYYDIYDFILEFDYWVAVTIESVYMKSFYIVV